MKAEDRIAALEAQVAQQQNELVLLRSQVVELQTLKPGYFEDQEWQRRLAAAKPAKEAAARAEAEWERTHVPPDRVRVRCRDTAAREITWREPTQIQAGSELRILPDGRSKEHVPVFIAVDQEQSLAGRGEHVELADVWQQRVQRSADLARLVESGELVVEPLSREQGMAIDRRERRQAAGRPLDIMAPNKFGSVDPNSSWTGVPAGYVSEHGY